MHIWGVGVCPLDRPGIAGQLGAGRVTTAGRRDLRDDHAVHAPAARTGCAGAGQPVFGSMNGYVAPVLDEELADPVPRRGRPLADPETAIALPAVQREHRADGLPAALRQPLRAARHRPVPHGRDGGFVIVRDHFLLRDLYHWADVRGGPAARVTQAMFFKPDAPLEVAIDDLGTMFTKPAQLPQAPDRGGRLRPGPLGHPGRATSAGSTTPRSTGSSRGATPPRPSSTSAIATLSWDREIRTACRSTTREFLLPVRPGGRALGPMVASGLRRDRPGDRGRLPDAGRRNDGAALGAVFLMGAGRWSRVRGSRGPDLGRGGACPRCTSWRCAAACAELPVPGTATGRRRPGRPHAGRLPAHRGRPGGTTSLAAERAGLDRERMGQAYERFLALNGPMKALSTRPPAGRGRRTPGSSCSASWPSWSGGSSPRCAAPAEQLPRFEAYLPRLRKAMRVPSTVMVEYLVSPTRRLGAHGLDGAARGLPAHPGRRHRCALRAAGLTLDAIDLFAVAPAGLVHRSAHRHRDRAGAGAGHRPPGRRRLGARSARPHRHAEMPPRAR